MNEGDKVVARYDDGRLLKGYLRGFTSDEAAVIITEATTGSEHTIPLDELKALFYVKTFEGSSHHRDKRVYSAGKRKGRKVYVQFYDKEKMMGFLDADIAPDKITSFLKPDGKTKGFFFIPADTEGNNTKVYVVWKAVMDITSLP